MVVVGMVVVPLHPLAEEASVVSRRVAGGVVGHTPLVQLHRPAVRVRLQLLAVLLGQAAPLPRASEASPCCSHRKLSAL